MAPGTSMFLHWLVGMLYVFYFASFILLLREVLRPGVLWFLRNLNDPDFNPVQEVRAFTVDSAHSIAVAFTAVSAHSIAVAFTAVSAYSIAVAFTAVSAYSIAVVS